MNFLRSRLAVGNLIGQWRRQVTHTQNRRMMCSKPQATKAEPQPAVPADASHSRFKTPGYKPSPFDRRILIWSGRFKAEDQIPDLVSLEMIDAARNRVRVKVCYIMMVLLIGSCVVMAYMGKQAAKRNESLTDYNMEKKAKWREELHRERDTASIMPAKNP